MREKSPILAAHQAYDEKTYAVLEGFKPGMSVLDIVEAKPALRHEDVVRIIDDHLISSRQFRISETVTCVETGEKGVVIGFGVEGVERFYTVKFEDEPRICLGSELKPYILR